MNVELSISYSFTVFNHLNFKENAETQSTTFQLNLGVEYQREEHQNNQEREMLIVSFHCAIIRFLLG